MVKEALNAATVKQSQQRSPIQKQHQSMLSTLNKVIGKIDTSDSIRMYQQRKVKANYYKLDKEQSNFVFQKKASSLLRAVTSRKANSKLSHYTDNSHEETLHLDMLSASDPARMSSTGTIAEQVKAIKARIDDSFVRSVSINGRSLSKDLQKFIKPDTL